MIKDVSSYVKNCPAYQKVKPQSASSPPFTGSLFAHKPFECLSKDTMGPFPEDQYNNKFIFVIVCDFTRFCILYPAPANDAHQAAQALINRVFCFFCLPLKIRSDKGSEYINDAISLTYKSLKIDSINSFPHHHASNGIVERRNREVLISLKKMLLEFQD
ncbi:hypothetical protein GEMRC1_000157 [Eukaryota sp. GEM-RC1]